MYAVFKTGGKQYRAATGDTIKVEKIDAEKGATVELDQVLMVVITSYSIHYTKLYEGCMRE